MQDNDSEDKRGNHNLTVFVGTSILDSDNMQDEEDEGEDSVKASLPHHSP
jgi:hypothetical protein